MSASTAAAAAVGGGPIRLKVRRLNGPDIVLQILPDAAVSQLKTILASQTQVSEGRQRLIYRGKVRIK
jgi:Ubiquitin family